MHGNGPPMHFQSPQQQAPPMSSNDLADLKVEIAQLISTTQARFASNYNDLSLRKTLEALLGLKQILDTQTLPPQQLDAVRKQIQALAPPPTPTPTFSPALPFGFPPAAYPPPTPTNAYPQHQMPPSFPPQFPPTGTPSGSAPPNVAQLLASFRPPPQHTPQPAPTPVSSTPSLADMLKRMSSPAQSASVSAPAPFQPPPFQFPPQMSAGMPFAPPPAPAPAATPTADLAALLAQFSKPGAAPPGPQATPVQSTPVPQLPAQPPVAPPNLGSAEWLLKALGGGQGLPLNGAPVAAQPMARQTSAPTNVMDQIELTTASMKKPRFHLVSRLYEAKPNICATCGRRFDATAEGKEKKARHMDWHFKVKDPDANKRGVHRSWYIGEKEWIDYREVDETAPPHESTATAAANKPKKQAKDRYISVPQDPVLQQAPCPICQEKFQTQWNVDANDFVWMDALQVGGKVYHATCFEEYSKGAGIPMPGTPDSVLGKRKADLGGEVEGKKVRAF
jgi:pre-mRNA cleavage complex 2 protein Pcf11